MKDSIEFRLASAEDEPALRSLLSAAALPVDDVSTREQDYVLAHVEGALVGCVGLEVHGDAGLLRSFAVAPASRGRGLGTRLFERIVARAILRGVETAYVLTTTAVRHCEAHGFERIDRAEVPAGIAATQQFRSLCPASAACFRRRLGSAAGRLRGVT